MKRLIYLVIFLLSISMVEAKVIPVDIDIGTEFVNNLEHVQGTIQASEFFFIPKTNKKTRRGIRPTGDKKTSNKFSNIEETQYYKSYLRMDLKVDS